MTETKPKRRWFTFSLRMLLLAMTVLCVWLGIQVNTGRRQHEAVGVLRKAGAEIAYDYQMVPRPAVPASARMQPMRPADKVFDPNQSPPGPAWLRQLIGDDCFCTVVRVWLTTNVPIQKADLDAVAKLPHVSELVLGNNSILRFGDKDLTVLGQLPRLEQLQLANAHIDGSCLASLPNPERLKILNLAGTDVDDATLEHVEKMTMLEVLLLDRTRVTDAGLVRLRNLKNLELLQLGNTNITDAGLEHLLGLKKLYLLNLDKTQVSDAGISKLWAVLPGNATIILQGVGRRPPR